MLNFDPKRYIEIESAAVGLALPLHKVVEQEMSAGTKNLFFLGCGGVAFLMQPAAQLLQRRSTFPTHVAMAAELVCEGNVHLGPGSLVVVPSVSGTTKEAVAGLRYAKSRGARLLTLTGQGGTPLADEADINFTNFVADDTSSEAFYLQSLLLALAVMDVRGEIANYGEMVNEILSLPQLLVGVKESFEDRAAAFAKEIADEQHHIMSSAGGSWFEAWYYGMCILEEMQWIWTRPVHASDFFHGTLELLEEDTGVVLLKGEDECRPLVERVERFATTITEKVRVFDAKEFPLAGVSEQVRALISPVLFAAALERVSAHLEVLRDHPLTTRRYYKKGDF
jgi:fructoselysine-6-phosphate deglycase